MIQTIPRLLRKKKPYPNAKPRVDCWNKSMSSAKYQMKKDNDGVKVIFTPPSNNNLSDDEAINTFFDGLMQSDEDCYSEDKESKDLDNNNAIFVCDYLV